MVSLYDVKKSVEKSIGDGKLEGYQIQSIDNKDWVVKDDLKIVSIEELTNNIRKKKHCDFECIEDEHVFCQSVLRCRECGTVLFYSYNDDGPYEPQLCCPTCSNYKTSYEYWTKEEIDQSKDKQDTIKHFEYLNQMMIEDEMRIKKRHGKHDYQLWVYSWYGKRHGFRLELNIDDITNKFKLKGLELSINILEKDSNIDIFKYTSHFSIPLSRKAFYLKCIYPYKKTTREPFRKYFPWQIKPRRED